MLYLRHHARVSSSSLGLVRLIHEDHHYRIFYQITQDKTFKEECINAGLSKQMMKDSIRSFADELIDIRNRANFQALKVQYVLSGISQSKYPPLSLVPLFLEHANLKFPYLSTMNDLRKISDLTKPTEWYPEARSMRRRIIFHAGPTNSGKTHAALEEFLTAKSGIYCCPLRLLAREVATKSRLRNVSCDLVTGEERERTAKSFHVACTVEMTNLNSTYEVAVVDEIQLLAHEERGWAWTRALLGVRAKEIHVCGEPRAIPIVRKLVKLCGDNFELNEYERLTKLRVKKFAVGDINNIKKGDCIVCFKRKEIYDSVSRLKSMGKDAAVIYGKLPPHTKRKEALKFNAEANPCNILVATDAIGMGLNLNIKRIVFNSLVKTVTDGKGDKVSRVLTTPEVLQIAGRAGRYGFQEDGEVTVMYERDIDNLHKLLLSDKENIEHARITPQLRHFLNFSNKMDNTNLYKVMEKFLDTCSVDHNTFELCCLRDSQNLARSLQHLNLPIADTYKFSHCPINIDNETPVRLFVSFTELYSQGEKVSLETVTRLLKQCGANIPFLPTDKRDRLMFLEDVFNALGSYLWLALQFPSDFPDYKLVFKLQNNLANIITLSLQNIRNRDSVLYKLNSSNGKRKKKKNRKS